MGLTGGKSKIHGNGVFSSRKISAGESFYNLDILKESEVFVPHWAWVEGRWISDEVLNKVNHSCEPNSYLNTKNLCLVSRREIDSGEEITLDYDLSEQGDFKVHCNCGSKNCRGFFLIRAQ